MICDCATRLDARQGRQGEYRRLKKALNRGQHPTYIGPNMVEHCARNGGLWFFRCGETDAAVALVNPRLSVLLTLNVLPEHRSHGLGAAIMRYLAPNWIRSTESAVPYFRRQGYQVIGRPKRGRTLRTILLVRADLLTLAGRVSRIFGEEEGRGDGDSGGDRAAGKGESHDKTRGAVSRR